VAAIKNFSVVRNFSVIKEFGRPVPVVVLAPTRNPMPRTDDEPDDGPDRGLPPRIRFIVTFIVTPVCGGPVARRTP